MSGWLVAGGGALLARKMYNSLTRYGSSCGLSLADSLLARVPLTGQRVLVTGSAGGLGFQLCKELLRRGVQAVVVVDLDQKQIDTAVTSLVAFATDLRRPGVVVQGYACNVSDSEAVKRMAQRCVVRCVFVFAALTWRAGPACTMRWATSTFSSTTPALFLASPSCS